MRRERFLERLAEVIAAVPAAHPVRVAITGIDAAGKTTLADELATTLEARSRPSVRVSIDDFYRPGHLERAQAEAYTPQTYYDEAFDYPALADCVLAPCGPGGGRRVRAAVFNAYLDRVGPPERVEVAADAVVLVDGVFLLHSQLRAHWDLIVWLELDPAASLARALARDAVYAPADVVRRRYLSRNYPAHDLYVARTKGQDAADVVVDNTDPLDPVLVRAPS